jgi:hypothetical protein
VLGDKLRDLGYRRIGGPIGHVMMPPLPHVLWLLMYPAYHMPTRRAKWMLPLSKRQHIREVHVGNGVVATFRGNPDFSR